MPRRPRSSGGRFAPRAAPRAATNRPQPVGHAPRFLKKASEKMARKKNSAVIKKGNGASAKKNISMAYGTRKVLAHISNSIRHQTSRKKQNTKNPYFHDHEACIKARDCTDMRVRDFFRIIGLPASVFWKRVPSSERPPPGPSMSSSLSPLGLLDESHPESPAESSAEPSYYTLEDQFDESLWTEFGTELPSSKRPPPPSPSMSSSLSPLSLFDESHPESPAESSAEPSYYTYAPFDFNDFRKLLAARR